MMPENLTKKKCFSFFKLCGLICFLCYVFTSTQLFKKTELSAAKNSKFKTQFILANDNSEFKVLNDSKTEQTVVLIYSNRRSGSSFLGDMFSKNPDVFYLFEPLYLFTSKCENLINERIDFLQRLVFCNFTAIREEYTKIRQVTNITDGAKCTKKTLCFLQNSPFIFKRYTSECVKNLASKQIEFIQSHRAKRKCGFPLKENIVSNICRKSPMLVYKLVRPCSLSGINNLYRKLKEHEVNLFVIHLVRDPRGIASSSLRLRWENKNVESIVNPLCSRMLQNIQFADEVPELVEDGKYMRVRYEDMALFPEKTADSLYNFIGKEIPSEIKTWLQETTNPRNKILQLQEELQTDIDYQTREMLENALYSLKRKLKNPFSTVRQSSAITERWRRMMKFDKVQFIQTVCAKTMKKLGYRFLNNTEEMKQFDNQLF